MVDPIATLSLVSSILQVIDFASGFAVTAWKIYQAADRGRDGPDEVVELRLINTNLANVLDDIQSQADSSKTADQHGNTDGIIALAKECETLVRELLQSLPDTTNIKRKRDAIRVAFTLKWNSEDIRALQSRLAEIRSQLTLQLLVSMRQYASQSLAQQENILKEISTSNRHSGRFNSADNSVDRIGSSILEYVTSKLSPASRVEERRSLQKSITQAIRSGPIDSYMDGIRSSNLFVARGVWADSLNDLLASLSYTGMDDREWRVAKAHHATFQWLFEEDEQGRKASFKDWLVSEEKLYWITGKAGSGKSTLMKYISHADKLREQPNLHARCHKHLLEWSRDKSLIIAPFYFWNSGTHMQTTQKGLMMTLLHHILSQCPDLAPLAFPAQWEMLCLFGNHARDWDERELRDAVHHAIENAPTFNAKIALFIDGLDEFEGKSEELLEFLHEILRLPDLKVCVSSRPWTEFEDAFRHKPSLRLEDLTYHDIKRFVASRFDAEQFFQDLRYKEGQYAENLIESIVSIAQGVFLWVALVVSSLIAGLTAGDRVVDLEKRLALLPPDLEGLYEKILLSLDPFYLEHAAQLFALVAASKGPMNVVLASFADEQAPEFCLGRQVQEMSQDGIQLCINTMHRRLNARTKGLLEVKRPSDDDASNLLNPESFTIQYLHRTVKDYVEGEMAQNALRHAFKSTFDPHLSLLAGVVSYMKTLNAEELTMNTVGQYLFQCMEYAREVTASRIPSMIVLLDELDHVISALWKRKAVTTAANRYGPLKKIREMGFWALEIGPIPARRLLDWRLFDRRLFGHTFLSIAVACNVVEYVRAKVSSPCIVKRPRVVQSIPAEITYESWPLIMDVISIDSPFSCISQDAPYADIFTPTRDDRSACSLIPMLKCLLDKGADPAYLINLSISPELKSSLLIEMVARMMRTQNQSLAEVTQLLVRATEVGEKTLARIIERFQSGPWGISTPYPMARSPGRLLWLKYYRERMAHAAQQKKMTQQLQAALDKLRSGETSEFLFNYAQVANNTSKHDIKQLALASHLIVPLTPGAKYHAPLTRLYAPANEIYELPA